MTLASTFHRMHLVHSRLATAVLNPRYCRSLLSSSNTTAFFDIRARCCTTSNNSRKDLVSPQKDLTVKFSSRITQLYIPVLRYTTTCESKGTFDSSESKDKFQLVYFIKYLTPIRFVSLLKVYQTVFVLGMFPVFGYLWSQGSITDEVFYSASSFMVFSTFMLFVIAQYFTSVICAIYIDENREKVRISHLTFRTRRKDVVLNIQDIHPIFDVNANKKDLYYSIKTFDKKHKFKLFLDYGTVHDQKLLAELLGKML